MGNGGWISPLPEYWPTVRKICTDYKALLIADEVITGFRQNRQDVCSSTLDCQRAMLKISERRVTENEKRFKNNGTLKNDSLLKIWHGSDLLWEIADKRNLKGKCNLCEFINQCSGCRAMAYACTGDYLAEDPQCFK